jgi:hypothetical protein
MESVLGSYYLSNARSNGRAMMPWLFGEKAYFRRSGRENP